MAGKQTGLSWTTLSVDNSAGAAKDIRNDITSLDWTSPRAVLDVTGIDKAAFERLLGLADFSVNIGGTFNPDADKSHAIFSDVPTTSVQRTVSIGIGGKTLAQECLFTSYDISRDGSGALGWKTTGVLANGTFAAWA